MGLIFKYIFVLLVVAAFCEALEPLNISCGSKICTELKPMCNDAYANVEELTKLVSSAKSQWKENQKASCDSRMKTLNTVVSIAEKFNDKHPKIPGRKKLNELPVICDDFITTMKGIIKNLEDFNKAKKLTCSNEQDQIAKATNKMANRVLRCGFGKREFTDEQRKLVTFGRQKREAVEDNELDEVPIAGQNGIVEQLTNVQQAKVRGNKILKLLKKNTRVQAKNLFGLNVTVEHKCNCTKGTCKCCLFMHTGVLEKSLSACFGIEMLEECQRKGIKLFFEILDLKTEFSIMEGSSSCVNIPHLPISICVEPYGFHFCPRRGTFRSCLMLQFELSGFKLASIDLDCLVLAKTPEGIQLRLRKSEPHWRPQEGALNILFSWLSDIFTSQYKPN